MVASPECVAVTRSVSLARRRGEVCVLAEGAAPARLRRLAGVLAALIVVAAPLVAAAAPRSPAVRWQRSATATGVASVTWLSCNSSTSCVASHNAVIGTEVAGRWGPAAPIPNIPPDSTVAAMACPSPGNCTVGGSDAGQAYLLDQRDGTWGTAQLVAGTAPYTTTDPEGLAASYTSSITAISCPTAATCSAAGNFTVALGPNGTLTYPGPGFATSEVGASWSAATFLSGIDAVTAIECASLQACTLSGYQSSFQIFVYYPIITNVAAVDTETSGTWAPSTAIPGLSNLAGKSGWIDNESTSLSCVSQGHCTVVGLDEYAPDFDGNPISLGNAKLYGFASREVAGSWETATELKALDKSPTVSCSSATQCVAIDAGDAYIEYHGTWGVASHFTVSAKMMVLNDASCAPGGPCVIVGSIPKAGLAVSENAGKWSKPSRLAGLSRATVVSCPAHNACTAAGGSMANRQVE